MWQKQYKQVNKEISDWMTGQRERGGGQENDHQVIFFK